MPCSSVPETISTSWPAMRMYLLKTSEGTPKPATWPMWRGPLAYGQATAERTRDMRPNPSDGARRHRSYGRETPPMSVSSGSRSDRSAEVELAGPGALDLEEVREVREREVPSQSPPASSPRGMRVSTGPKNAEPLIAIVGGADLVADPVDAPLGATRAGPRRTTRRPSRRPARPSPASARAATISSRPISCFSWWIRSRTRCRAGERLGPSFCSGAISTRPTGSPRGRAARGSLGESRSLFRKSRLITRHCTRTSRTCSTSSIQREVIQANGQSGSNQKSAVSGCRGR